MVEILCQPRECVSLLEKLKTPILHGICQRSSNYFVASTSTFIKSTSSRIKVYDYYFACHAALVFLDVRRPIRGLGDSSSSDDAIELKFYVNPGNVSVC